MTMNQPRFWIHRYLRGAADWNQSSAGVIPWIRTAHHIVQRRTSELYQNDKRRTRPNLEKGEARRDLVPASYLSLPV